jgi:hypothetical protein
VRDERGLLQAALGDGRFLIALTGISLCLSGGFAILQSISGQLLPHDTHAIGKDAMALLREANAHLTGFMFHDRVAYGGGIILAGLTVAIFRMTMIFVPSDLRFIGLDVPALQRISPMLIPVISHDRAGFGGGLCSIGSLLLFMARCAELSRSLIEVVTVMGLAGFGCAIGVHFAVGYLDFMHLLPAFVGFAIFLLADGLLWSGRRRVSPSGLETERQEPVRAA